MGNRLEGKVALITGAAGGVGLATAERFVQEGASVVLGDSQVDLLDRESARLAAAGFRVRAVAMDVTRTDDVKRAVAVCCSEFGRMDILFANAGIGYVGAIVDTSDDDWDRVMGVNAKGGVSLLSRGRAAVSPAGPARRLDRDHRFDIEPDRDSRPGSLRTEQGCCAPAFAAALRIWPLIRKSSAAPVWKWRSEAFCSTANLIN